LDNEIRLVFTTLAEESKLLLFINVYIHIMQVI